MRETPLWYQGNISEYEYGFIKSINGTSGEILNDDRYLVDNLMAIFLLLENDVQDLSLTSSPTPIELIESQFLLINSSEFWDDSDNAFREFNSSTTEKYVESNLYAILANILFHRATELDSDLRTQAYYLANTTMTTLMQNLWDNLSLGFYYKSTGSDSTYKYLSTNALGILTLLESWIETGMKNDTSYFENATLLYQKINNSLWNSTFKAYEYRRTNDWHDITGLSDKRIDLESNSLMLSACVKFFDVTGNISYYDKAIELFNSLEQYFYDEAVNSYNSSIGTSTNLNNGNKNLYANLVLSEAYLNLLNTYNSTFLVSLFNVSETIPNYVLNQDTLQLECNYSFIKNNTYFSPSSQAFEPNETRFDISNSSITYIFRYPNETVFKTVQDVIKSSQVGVEAASCKISCIGDSNGNLNGTYFNITTPFEKFYVWFNLSKSGGPDPGFSDRIPIEVKISVNASKGTVATEIYEALQSYGGTNTFFDVSSLNTENFTVMNSELGEIVQYIIDGSSPHATNFTFLLLNNGLNITVAEHIQLFPITENLTIASNYRVDIFANTTYFRIASTYQYFNIISGLENDTILGLDSVFFLYQGQTVNITLPINSIRKDNITLNVTLEGEGIFNITDEILFINASETNVEFNITALNNVTAKYYFLSITFRREKVIYLTVNFWLLIADSVKINNLIYTYKLVSEDYIHVSFNLVNFLQNNSQSVNISFTSIYIVEFTAEINLEKMETKALSFNLKTYSNILEDTINIKMEVSKNNTIIVSTSLTVEILPKFKIISFNFPEKISQGVPAYLSLIIVNNQQNSEKIALILNDEKVSLEDSELLPGRNKIEYEFIPSTNPYDFQKKGYKFGLEDNSGNVILEQFFEVEFNINPTNLILFYLFPIIIPIGIVLYYKNRYLKLKIVRR